MQALLQHPERLIVDCEAPAQDAYQRLFLQCELIEPLQPVGTGQLRRRRGGRGPEIGGEVSDTDVGFMANAGNDRNLAGENGPRHPFFIKGPQVFQRAATPHQQQYVAVLSFRSQTDCSGNRWRGAISLHRHRVEQHRQGGKPAPQHVQHVLEGGTARRSDDADPARESG